MPEFKFFLPAITALNSDQQLAYDPRTPMLITGGPGSGKTVVTIYRFLRTVLEQKNIMLFTYNRALIYSIKGTLKDRSEELFGDFDQQQVDQVVDNQLSTFYYWHYSNITYYNPQEAAEETKTNFESYAAEQGKFDELFFDEGQDLPRTVYQNAFILSEVVSVGADRAQNYKGHYTTDELEDVILEALKSQDPASDRQYLQLNYRNTKEIFEFAKEFMKSDPRVLRMNTDRLKSGNQPDIRLNLNQAQQLNTLLEIIQANANSNIGILVHSTEEITIIKTHLEQNGYSCAMNAPLARSFSYYYYGMSKIDEKAMQVRLSSPFITTFESCKGLEFDVVVLPFFERADVATNTLNKDGRPKATLNHYYVAITRAKTDFFVLCHQKPEVMAFYTPPAPDEDDDLPF
ncbi:3'-5' exonuclease [Pedobacter jeongneungensis]|uniref:3'-5' exonuclease n=1 Tax=Pedobacter jeongneungensis TaxID=947309 RepID=UPI00046858B1|nr:3'-5' exonuclease [Pedobacter jeongneungensis]